MIRPLTFFLSVLVLAGCTGQKSNKSNAGFEPKPIVLEELQVTPLAIGAEMPAFELPDMNGRLVSSNNFKDAKILVIAFISNHCPTAQAYEDRLISFTKDYQDRGVQVVAINPNSSLALLPDECGYSDLDDAFETMIVRAEHKGYNFPYLYDGDNHAASLKFGPVSTPHVFVFDADNKLRYNGRLDGIERPGTANAEDLRLAVDQVLLGEEVTNPITSTFGCSVKWSWKASWANKVNKDWISRPVEISQIDESGVRELMKNDSEKLRLINVWASWCAPCVIEMPELVMLQRYYENRAFELVTISADYLDKESEALKVLKKNNVAVQNFIFSDKEKQKLTSAIDPEWRGSIPYSILIEPGGNIIYKTQGVIDDLAIKRIIVEHPLLGRYF
ncbi:MAG TPA: redoxin family protein [Dysgonamonadaceae bacterium]|nr:redoxin family protein [Dysgonamonadaceae bacterium]